MILQKLTVSFEYPVLFTERVFDPANKTLAETMAGRALLILDANVALRDDPAAYFKAHSIELAAPPLLVPGGEGVKNDLSFLRRMVSAMVEARLCRHSFVIAVGGGAVLDAAGLAAALVHRGLRLIRLPTTVLGQGDSGVGVKNGVNLHGIKNALGVFAPPFAVINDFCFLLSLPDREWISGLAEAFKVAIIRDRGFFDFLSSEAARLRSRDAAGMQFLVRRCAELHLEHARKGDPFETGRARPLDFGHWSAHKLEAMSNFAILHGEAVAVGILLDCSYAALQGWITREEFRSIHRAVGASGLPLWFDLMLQRKEGRLELFDGLEDFREHLGGGLCITFPRGIGSRFETGEIDLGAMEEALLQLRSGRDQR